MEPEDSLPHSQESTTCPYSSQINPFLCPSHFWQAQLISFLVGLRTYQHPCNMAWLFIESCQNPYDRNDTSLKRCFARTIWWRPPARENFIASWIYVPFSRMLIWWHSLLQEALCSVQLVSDAVTHYSAILVQIQSIATQGTRLVIRSNRYSGGLSHDHVKPILYVGNIQQFLLQQVVYMFTNSSKTLVLDGHPSVQSCSA